MSCTLVIPTRNDTTNLKRLLEQAFHMKCFARAIVVDDASDSPLSPELCLLERPDWVHLTRHENRKGAGAARNLGLQFVETSHLLFFDSDDLLTPEIPHLLADLDGREFDFCIFKHNDSRVSAAGSWGQTRWDEALWRHAGVAVGALRPVSPSSAPTLARTANYPWNKIYRTDFLRDNGLRCSETLVHNDILLHWASFIRARDILSSDRIAAIHHVGLKSGRLTDHSGPERLAVFNILRDVLNTEIPGDRNFFAAFLGFASYLFGWIRGVIAPSQQPALDAQIRQFLLAALSPGDYRNLTVSDPVLALRINLQLAETRRAGAGTS
ncbi:glycosyltransferase family 2 protein [Pontibaca methylaminivorans]|uniref:Glycosyl transferase family 2 n=1 Tax=Pontibaca methylaminivorans TaxID=515897 RepID=A0A1R3W9M3_9RHOB|nr:glycosyltransferase [Pontibaca methylaminivorans]SIT74431.1 Glycosyl transferase family 2 [Pontibaca methylaminivorans]